MTTDPQPLRPALGGPTQRPAPGRSAGAAPGPQAPVADPAYGEDGAARDFDAALAQARTRAEARLPAPRRRAVGAEDGDPAAAPPAGVPYAPPSLAELRFAHSEPVAAPALTPTGFDAALQAVWTSASAGSSRWWHFELRDDLPLAGVSLSAAPDGRWSVALQARDGGARAALARHLGALQQRLARHGAQPSDPLELDAGESS